MTSYYNQIPSFEEQVRAANLIIVGQVSRLVDEKTDSYNDERQEKRIYQVAVAEVLKGRLDEKEIALQVVSGTKPQQLAELQPELKEGEQYVMFLAPNYGPERAPNQYVPYFQSLFPVTREGEVRLNEPVARSLEQDEQYKKGAELKLDDLREMVSMVVRAQEAEEEMKLKAEPLEQREAPAREIQEMPPQERGGPRFSAPDQE